MTISEIREQPLPNDIVEKLIVAAEAHSKAETLLIAYPEIGGIASELLSVLDARFYVWQTLGENVSIDDTIKAYAVGNSESHISKFIQIYKACEGYAQKKKTEIGLLTAVDVIKINKAICNLEDSVLCENDLVFDSMPDIESFWATLSELYNPTPQYHRILESAIALSRFMCYLGKEKLDIATAQIIFSTLPEKSFAFGGMMAYWIRLTDPRTELSSLDRKDMLLHILTVFQTIWDFQSTLVDRLIVAKKNISQNLESDCSGLNFTIIEQLLCGSLFFRIQEVRETLSVSKMTAIKYLHLLERLELLNSIKIGRDKFYFNSSYCDLMNDLI